LLKGDGPDEGGEVIRPLNGSKAAGAMPPDQRRQYWITAKQNPPRACVVVGRHRAES
jgi:hypothetical protein